MSGLPHAHKVSSSSLLSPLDPTMAPLTFKDQEHICPACSLRLCQARLSQPASLEFQMLYKMTEARICNKLKNIASGTAGPESIYS